MISFIRSVHLSSLLAVAVFLAGQSPAADAAVAGTVNLGTTPPDLTSSVDPNIVVTFDDSGSMTSHYMGDTRPFDGANWGAPWGCAAVIDPRITDPADARSRAMNGVYYNPNVNYVPPIYSDASAFPNADATLAAVWADGIAIKRPLNPVSPNSPADNDNPDSSSGGNDNRVTYINGIKSGGTDRRWTCGYGSYPTAFVGGENVNSGGPYYYRLISTANPVNGDGTINTGVLYTSSNWEAVRVNNVNTTLADGTVVNQWQNFANWYAYYRTRNLMTRSALSRVFANLGNNIRVAWQNINDGTYALATNVIITNLFDTNSYSSCKTQDPSATFSATTQPACYRSALYNWIFQTGANGTTPDRASTIRAGKFFQRGNGNTGATGNLKDPYWQPSSAGTGAPARELSCRQNFHMLVTDGYWNEGDPSLPSPYRNSQTTVTLPTPADPDTPAVTFDNSAAASRVFWDVQGSLYNSSLANIAFNYWATDLRPDLTNNVAPYMPDKTTGVTGPSGSFDPGATPPANNPINNTEIYFNPANDPASWQHVVQFMVTLGIAGNLTFSEDVDGNDPTNDLYKLRKGLSNSSGAVGWPRPSNNARPAIDDTWHAAINSRGSYFSANDPSALVSYLTAILANVLVRSTSSTQPTLSLPFAFSGAAAFSAGYDSGDWSGTLTRVIPFDANGAPIVPPTKVWEAGCTLTGGNCPNGTKTARDPNSRVILTSSGPGLGSGIGFRWTNLTTAQKKTLNTNPTSIAASPNQASWTLDNYGDKRVDYLRGDRTYEVGSTPQFRRRGSVLGAIVNAQPTYNAAPESGWTDNWPAGSAEAAVVGTNGDYAHFVNDNISRAATVYAASNDGMLHAFNAVDGTERWAYVPNVLFSNGNITRNTDKSRGLTPGVDGKPTVQDVFINGHWRTVLVGAMRLGGRAVYALDVTTPNGVTESGANNTVLWEYSNGSTGGANLGYTYGSPQIVRLNNGKWAVLVASGYFPNGPTTDSYDDPASTDPAAGRTSLLVIDLETGALIRELKTSTAPQFGGTVTYGLSTPGVYDIGGDQVDDLAVAGDLAGNVWRFDLQNSDPTLWKVDLLFKTYPSAATNGATGTCTTVGQCPVSVMPVGMRNPAARGIVWIFGTGKFLGKDDRSNAIPAQSFYGVYDMGTAAAAYPILPANMQVQGMTEDTANPPNRFVTAAPVSVPAGGAKGWTLPLNIAAETGERNVVTPFAVDQNNTVVLPTLIPTSDDPCTPGRRGALIVLDAASGNGAAISPAGGSPPAGYIQAGKVDTSGAIPSTGELSPYTVVGGGAIGIAGINGFRISDNYWYRAAWRELLDLL